MELAKEGIGGAAKTAFGSFVGDGTKSHTINCGFAPDIFVCQTSASDYYVFKYMLFDYLNNQAMIQYMYSNSSTRNGAQVFEFATLTDSGITVFDLYNQNVLFRNGTTYYWAAAKE